MNGLEGPKRVVGLPHVCILSYLIIIQLEHTHTHTHTHTVCPTRYRTRHFFNNFTTNEEISMEFEAGYRHIPLHFSHNERTPVKKFVAISSLVLELLKKCRVR